MTNADWIRSFSDEDLAIIYVNSFQANICPYEQLKTKVPAECQDDILSCRECIARWAGEEYPEGRKYDESEENHNE